MISKDLFKGLEFLYTQGQSNKLIEFWESKNVNTNLNLSDSSDEFVCQILARSYFEVKNYSESLKYATMLKDNIFANKKLSLEDVEKCKGYNLDFLVYVQSLHERKLYFREYVELLRYKKIGGLDQRILESIQWIENSFIKKKISGLIDYYPLLFLSVVVLFHVFFNSPSIIYIFFLTVSLLFILSGLFKRSFTLNFSTTLIRKTLNLIL
jgi:hypothetical protein